MLGWWKTPFWPTSQSAGTGTCQPQPVFTRFAGSDDHEAGQRRIGKGRQGS
jgi:hypothetical protein